VRDFAPGAPAFRGPAELTAHQRIGEFFSLATADSVQQYMAEQQRRAAQDNAKLETGNQALSQANIHLQAADLTRQELTSTVAHELRNFLQGFNSALAVLEIDPSNQDALVTARRQTRDMEQLLEHLLAYSTLLDKHAAVTAQPFELQALHHELLQAYSPVAQGKGLVLEGSCDGAPTEVTTDRLKIKQIAANLLSNAIKYTPSGSVRLDFSAHDAQHWLLAVTDTGDGIGEEDQAHLFRRFERLSSHPDIPGSGLGLAVVKELVDLLEGQIQFSSTPGSGSRFQAIIPRVYRRET
jgi:signal transduction histidine kinase